MQLGCLLIHGWTGSPFEMQPLVQPLEEVGVVVKNVQLRGHGTTFSDFCTTYFSDWRSSAEEAYEEFSAEVDAVVVCGLSMGGTLSLHLASRYPVAGVITLASPVYVYSLFPPRMKDWRLPFVKYLQHIRPLWPSRTRFAEVKKIAPWQGYEGMTSLPQLQSLIEGVRQVGEELEKVSAPLLAVHCPTDKTAPAENAWEIATRVSSTQRRIELVSIAEKVTAHHMLTTHIETKEKVTRLVVDFVQNLCEK